MNRINYDAVMDSILGGIEREGLRPRLLLQACCAPCSSYVLERIGRHFDITLLYFNPNIYPEDEFRKRLSELERFVSEAGYPFRVTDPGYDPDAFFEAVKGLEDTGEGGERCRRCYELRLPETARRAAAEGYDFFGTTLSISPYKNAEWLNEIGLSLEKEYGVRYLVSDFKKRNGYKRSIELSAEYGLYRQDYCGCVFSKKEYSTRRSQERTAPEDQKTGS